MKYSFKHKLLGMAVAVIAGFSGVSSVKAADSYDFTGYNKMDGAAVKSLLSGRTFWGRKQFDRYYFGADGTFAEQIVKSGGLYQPGTTRTGKWSIDADGALCWAVTAVNVGAATAPACYDVYMGPDKFKPLPKYTDPLYIVRKGDTSREKVKFFWTRWIDGRLVFEPNFAAQFESHMAYMKNVHDQFDANKYKDSPPVKDIESLSDEGKKYLQTISGQVLFTPYHFLYFAPNGDYVFYNRKDFKGSDIAKIKQHANRGRWILHGNVHCWSLFGDAHRTSCQMIGNGTTLDHKFNGFVTHMQDGFSRLLNGKPVGIMSLEQTGNPKAFQF